MLRPADIDGLLDRVLCVLFRSGVVPMLGRGLRKQDLHHSPQEQDERTAHLWA